MSRSYTVGLPVVISVEDDGSVSAWVDLSEASDLEHDNMPEEQRTGDEVADYDMIDADSKAIRAALEAGTVTVSQ